MTQSDMAAFNGEWDPHISDADIVRLGVPSVAEMHSGLRALISEHLESEPVLLTAAVGMGDHQLARSLLADTVGYTLDPIAAGGDARLLVARITRQVIERLAALSIETLDEPGLDAEQARLRVTRAYGARAGEALAAAQSQPPAGWSLADALGVQPERPLLVARNAHRLPESILWELRDLASAGSARVLLLSRTGHTTPLRSQAAPFFGMGWSVEMHTLTLVNWTAKLPFIGGDLLRALLERTRYRTASTLEVALEIQHSPRDIRTAMGHAWISALAIRRTRAYELLRIAAAIHELAPRLLLILADGLPPYSVLSQERPGRVSLALQRLREYELIEQHKPRSWQIADPLLSGALAQLEPTADEAEHEIDCLPDD